MENLETCALLVGILMMQLPWKAVWWSSKIEKIALAGGAPWIECEPANQMVASSIPSQGTCLGCRLGPQWWARERQPHTDVSLPPFLSH